MKMRSFTHKGLKRFYEGDNAKGIPSVAVQKLQDIFTFLEAISDAEELRRVPTWKAHLLTGNRKGEWSLSITRNWRLTFWIDEAEPAVCDLNLEDYH
jgi:proteic killer suppression protein